MHAAGFGTDHVGSGCCKFHGGSTNSHLLATSRAEAANMGSPLPVSPGQAIISVMQMAAGQYAYASMKVAELEDDQLFVETEAGPMPNRWFRLQQSLMRDLAKYARAAADMGVQAAQLQMAQELTAKIGDLLEAIMNDLELSAKQRSQVGPTIRKHLAVITGGGPDANASLAKAA